MTKLQKVVELPEFQRRAKAIMSDREREAAIVWIAENPEAGTSLGGGLRKVRIPRDVCLWWIPYADLSDHGVC